MDRIRASTSVPGKVDLLSTDIDITHPILDEQKGVAEALARTWISASESEHDRLMSCFSEDMRQHVSQKVDKLLNSTTGAALATLLAATDKA